MNVKKMMREARNKRLKQQKLIPFLKSNDAIVLEVCKVYKPKELLVFEEYYEIPKRAPEKTEVSFPRNFIAPTDEVFMWLSKNYGDNKTVIVYSNYHDHVFNVMVNAAMDGEGSATCTYTVDISSESNVVIIKPKVLLHGLDYVETTCNEAVTNDLVEKTIILVAWAMRDIEGILDKDFEVIDRKSFSASKSYTKRPPKGVSIIQVKKAVRNKNYTPPTTTPGSKQAPCNVIRHIRHLSHIKYNKDKDGNTLPLRYDDKGNPYYKIAYIDPYKKGGGVDSQIKIYQKG